MSRQLIELEATLQQQVNDYHKLLAHLVAHQAAMKKLDLPAMAEVAKLQESTRLRLANLENRRRALVKQIAPVLRLGDSPTISAIAEAVPQMRDRLLSLRDQLRKLTTEVAARASIAGRVAGAVLGHMNTVVRLISGAVEQAGLYTRDGTPKVSRRIGVMEAVG